MWHLRFLIFLALWHQTLKATYQARCPKKSAALKEAKYVMLNEIMPGQETVDIKQMMQEKNKIIKQLFNPKKFKNSKKYYLKFKNDQWIPCLDHAQSFISEKQKVLEIPELLRKEFKNKKYVFIGEHESALSLLSAAKQLGIDLEKTTVPVEIQSTKSASMTKEDFLNLIQKEIQAFYPQSSQSLLTALDMLDLDHAKYDTQLLKFIQDTKGYCKRGHFITGKNSSKCLTLKNMTSSLYPEPELADIFVRDALEKGGFKFKDYTNNPLHYQKNPHVISQAQKALSYSLKELKEAGIVVLDENQKVFGLLPVKDYCFLVHAVDQKNIHPQTLSLLLNTPSLTPSVKKLLSHKKEQERPHQLYNDLSKIISDVYKDVVKQGKETSSKKAKKVKTDSIIQSLTSSSSNLSENSTSKTKENPSSLVENAASSEKERRGTAKTFLTSPTSKTASAQNSSELVTEKTSGITKEKESSSLQNSDKPEPPTPEKIEEKNSLSQTVLSFALKEDKPEAIPVASTVKEIKSESLKGSESTAIENDSRKLRKSLRIADKLSKEKTSPKSSQKSYLEEGKKMIATALMKIFNSNKK
ncbi:MAG: hypothetical protein BGO07_03035 [Alphaproteobacteria bacterium 40-19]|nr:MAG: hypothetical protein BGO07_03035 [Alphaproteobacteria bacterium 40-19]